MTMKNAALVLMCFGVLACGGKKGKTTPDEGGGSGVELGGSPDLGGNKNDPNMVSNEQMDEVNRMFERRGKAVSRCLAIVVDNKELPKNSRGKVTIEVRIQPSGKVGSVKILKATLESKPLNDCVIERVKEIDFPKLPKEYPTTYTYAFEAM
jgi:TonB family protein